MQAPLTAAKQTSAATPASDTVLGFPRSTSFSDNSITWNESSAVSIGIWMAYLFDSSMADSFIFLSSSVPSERRLASMTRLKAFVSSSTKNASRSFNCCASTPISFISSFLVRNSFFSWVKAATIDARDAPIAPARAETLPPPGAGLLVDSSFINSFPLWSISGLFFLLTA